VGHNWVFKRAFLDDFWGMYSQAFQSRFAGEDIHISYCLQRNRSIKTIVPAHPIEDFEMWGERPTDEIVDGTGIEAISQSPEGLRRFEKALKHYRGLGFKTVLEREGRAGQSPIGALRGHLISLSPHIAVRFGTVLKKIYRRK